MNTLVWHTIVFTEQGKEYIITVFVDAKERHIKNGSNLLLDLCGSVFNIHLKPIRFGFFQRPKFGKISRGYRSLGHIHNRWGNSSFCKNPTLSCHNHCTPCVGNPCRSDKRLTRKPKQSARS